jgi:hypothetical protein
MMPNPADKIALKALTKPTEKALKDKAIGALRNEEHLEAFNLAFRLYVHQTPQNVPVAELSRLIRAGLFQSAEFLFLRHGKDIETLSIDDCLVAAATTKCVNQWTGKGDAEKQKVAMLVERFLSSPSEAMTSVLAKWFFESAPVDMVHAGVGLFATRKSEQHFCSTAELLKNAIERDKTGKILAEILSLSSTNPYVLEDLQREVEKDQRLFELFIRLVPLAVNPSTADSITQLLPVLFAELSESEAHLRKRYISGQLLHLSSLLLTQPWSVESDRVLVILNDISEKISESMAEGTIERDVCVINYLGRLRSQKPTHLTPFGAKLMASAIGHLRDGDDPLMTLEVTAFNLGMREIAEVGEITSFEPSLHHDTVGGTLKGATVVVETSGWQLAEQVIERANVKPS